MFPIYRKYVDEHFEEGYDSSDTENWINKCFACKHRVKMDLFKRYGLIAAAGDRHLAEFMPGDTYLKNPQVVESWDFGLTPVSWRKKDLEDRLARAHRLAGMQEEVELKPTGEEGILLIKALCGLERVVSNVNIPNTCLQIANLPKEAVVETNAIFERDSIRPIFAGSVPENVLELLKPHIENHERTLKAVETCDRNLVKEAFKADPLIKGRATDEAIEKLADDMIENTIKYLPAGWK